MHIIIRQLMDKLFDLAPLMPSHQYWVMCGHVQTLHSSLDTTHNAKVDRTIRYLRRCVVRSLYIWLDALKRSHV